MTLHEYEHASGLILDTFEEVHGVRGSGNTDTELTFELDGLTYTFYELVGVVKFVNDYNRLNYLEEAIYALTSRVDDIEGD